MAASDDLDDDESDDATDLDCCGNCGAHLTEEDPDDLCYQCHAYFHPESP